jgi:hypothetical protein
VENAENRRILWSVEGGERFGSVSEGGLYQTPPSLPTPGVVRVKASAVADPSKSTVIQVRVPEAGLSVSPTSAELRPGQSLRLQPKVRGCNGSHEVLWTLTPQVGSVSPDGVYRAPQDGKPQVVQVTAILKADPTKTAVTTVRLRGR